MLQERRKDFDKRAAFNEDIFRTMFRIASVGMVVSATDGRRILDVNEKFCEITGLTREALIGMSTAELTHPDDRGVDDVDYARAVNSASQQRQAEKRYLLKDGVVVWVRINASFMRDAEGKAFRTLAVVEDITARVQAETALRDSERRLTAFLDGMPDRARLKDADGRFIAANLSEARALGVSSVSELIGKTLADFRPQEKSSAVAAEERDIIASGKTLRVERQARDGSWLEMIKAPIKDDKGGFSGLVTIARDITERKRAENELRESEHRLREFLDGIPDRAWYKDAQGRLLFINARQAEAYGFDVTALIGKSAHDIMDPEHAARVIAEDSEVINSGQTVRLVRRSNLDGAWSEIVKTPVRRLDGSIAGMVGIARDITESKNAEEAVRESEGKLRALLDAIPDRAWLKGTEGQYLAANRSTAEFFGLTTETIVGKTNDVLFPPNMLAQIKEEELRILETLQPIRVERQFGRKGRWYETIKTPIKTLDGKAAGLVAISRDITDRKQAEDELRAAKAAAESANRAKGEFLSHMSHEMRTPMNAILGFAELAMLEQPDANQGQHLSKISAAAQSLLRVVDDVLDFERVDSGNLKLDTSDFRLGDVLQNVRDVVEHAASGKGLALRFKVVEGTPSRLHGDSVRIGQVLMNLCANAIKFTERGFVEVVVRAEQLQDAKVTLKFEVRDTGIGISEDDRSRLFQPFTQADNSNTRRYGGTGLGLVICKRLVGVMGGDIWIESQPGEGSVVFFTIVCGVGQVPKLAQDQLREQLPEEAAALLGKRVLVVDDHPINRMLMAKLLRLAGAEAVPAENGADALRVLEQEPRIELVLMDLRMPEMDGYEATRRIRADARWARLPIIAVTASAATYERARCMAAGMNDVMIKPIQQATFFPVVAAAMQAAEDRI